MEAATHTANMETSKRLALESNGQPKPYSDEVTYRIQADIDLYDRDSKTEHRRGVLTLTSHRLYWCDAGRKTAIQWHLAQVVQTSTEEGGFFSSAKVLLKLRHLPGVGGNANVIGSPSATNGVYPSLQQTSSAGSQAAIVGHVKFSFKEGGRDAFLQDVIKAVSRQAWVVDTDADGDALVLDGQTTASSSQPGQRNLTEGTAKRGRLDGVTPASSQGHVGAGSGPASSAVNDGSDASNPVVMRVGVGAVLEQRAKRMEASKQLASDAFQDLDNLAAHAKRVVQLAESYAAELQKNKVTKQQSVGAGGSGGPSTPTSSSASSAAEESQLSALISAMGIVSPVTKEMAGKMYLQEVARQLAAFIKPKLESEGGMMLLSDVFAVYNRARGTDLISPEDLLDAVRLMQTLGLGMRHRVYQPGGLTVLQLDTVTDEAVKTRVLSMLVDAAVASHGNKPPFTAASLAADPYLAPLDVATALRMPLPIAKQHLLLAEAAGLLCRDESIHGIRFYLNRFVNKVP